MVKKFSYEKQILEQHLDTFGHVNNAVYLSLYEEARWDFITKAGLGLDYVLKNQIGPVILDLQISFKAEIQNREVILIESEFKKMKNLFVMEIDQKMIKADGVIASQITLSMGILDMKKRKLLKPSEKWTEAIIGNH